MDTKSNIIIVLLVLIVFGLWFFFLQKPPVTKLILPEQNNMNISSSTFQNGQMLPVKYTCDGEGVNPPLAITQVPENTKSLVIILDDPDAPSGDFVHWILWNINPKTSLITENSMPEEAVQGRNSAGKNSYFGPCPPMGIHHYHFKIYALDTVLELDASSKKSDVEDAMQNHVISFAEIIGLYKRK